MRVPSCSSLSSALGESLAGTASLVRRWVLIEDPGPWGYDALTQNRVPADLMNAVRPWADHARARIVLVRSGAGKAHAKRKLFLVHSDRERGWIRALTSDDAPALANVDPRDWSTGEGFGGKLVDSLYLVCTHGRHDRCCSVRGNPVARELRAKYSESAWESSHIGGDRFAANIVCLPTGAYFGRVRASDAGQMIDDFEDGVLDLECFRGWSSLPFAVQAAEIAVRRNLALDRVDDVVPQRWTKPTATKVEVEMSVAAMGPLDVEVEITKSADAYYLTCRATEPAHPLLFETTSKAT